MIPPSAQTKPSAGRVLVIEDSRVDRELISLLLKNTGFEVHAAGSLAEGFSFLKAGAHDVIVLDEQLPDGLSSQHLNPIRKHEPTAPIIFLSGQHDLATVLRAGQHNIASIFNKPANPKILLAKICELAVPRAPRPAAVRADSSKPLSGSGFRWKALPGASPAHRALGERLFKVRDFRTTLLLIGHPGCAFLPIVRDLHANSTHRASPLVAFSAAGFNRAAVLAKLARHANSPGTTTLALAGIGTFDTARAGTLEDILDFRGEFKPYTGRLRCILSATAENLDHPVPTFQPDTLERVATLLVNVPELTSFGDDLVKIAGSLLCEEGVSPKVTLPEETVVWFEKRRWPGDYRQLRRVMLAAATSARPLTPEILESAHALEPTLAADTFDVPVAEFSAEPSAPPVAAH
jgi:DNA-binding NtrC family response regulator